MRTLFHNILSNKKKYALRLVGVMYAGCAVDHFFIAPRESQQWYTHYREFLTQTGLFARNDYKVTQFLKNMQVTAMQNYENNIMCSSLESAHPLDHVQQGEPIPNTNTELQQSDTSDDERLGVQEQQQQQVRRGLETPNDYLIGISAFICLSPISVLMLMLMFYGQIYGGPVVYPIWRSYERGNDRARECRPPDPSTKQLQTTLLELGALFCFFPITLYSTYKYSSLYNWVFASPEEYQVTQIEDNLLHVSPVLARVNIARTRLSSPSTFVRKEIEDNLELAIDEIEEKLKLSNGNGTIVRESSFPSITAEEKTLYALAYYQRALLKSYYLYRSLRKVPRDEVDISIYKRTRQEVKNDFEKALTLLTNHPRFTKDVQESFLIFQNVIPPTLH